MVVLLMTVLLCTAMPVEPMVAIATSTMQQIEQTQQEIDNLENQLGQTQENLENLKGEHSDLRSELNNLNVQLTEVSNNLASLEQQIRDKEQEISDTQESLAQAKDTERWQYECMVIRVRDMYERNDNSYLNAILSTNSLNEILNAEAFYQRIADYDQKKLTEFKENRKLIEEQEAQLQIEKTELDHLKVAAEAEKNKVSGLISQTSNAMASYADQISEAERKALEYEEQIKSEEANLETLQKKLQEELAMSQAAAQGSWRDISQVTFAEGDRYLLANLIYCEAGGEPYAGQLAVGSVVINRVLSSVYPDSVVGVIYQRKQFSPVASGRLDLALAANKATASCYQAADEAMSGVTNVGSCVYFRTPIEGLTGINIGGHVFY
ncbi:MAG: cell wall hydrolase [Lachnospiraceae bacterium]|nr:cell wall hydrolase [Lachnospiraceae bacterium]